MCKIVGWVVVKNGELPLAKNGEVVLFSSMKRGLKKRGYMDTCEPVTQLGLEIHQRRVDND